jgi:hypothetical protein
MLNWIGALNVLKSMASIIPMIFRTRIFRLMLLIYDGLDLGTILSTALLETYIGAFSRTPGGRRAF